MRFTGLSLTVALSGLVFQIVGLHPAAAGEVEVHMLNKGPNHPMQFDPEMVQIAPGDSVHLVATDKGHYAQSITGMLPNGAQRFAGVMGQDLTITFTTPGVYGYHCVPHGVAGMVGLIVVGDPVNEAEARQIALSGPERQSFAKLFDRLDRTRNAHAER